MKKNKLLMLIPANIVTVAPISAVSCAKTCPEQKFINDSWEEVCKWADQGFDSLKDHYHLDTFVGIKKPIMTVMNGVEYKNEVIVVDENKDRIRDQGLSRAALTLQLNHLLGTTQSIFSVSVPHATTSWWGDSTLLDAVTEQMTGALESDLLSHVKTVQKFCLNKDGHVVTISGQKFFLPSISEIYGDDLMKTEWFEGADGFVKNYIQNKEMYLLEGEQYAYYKKNVTKESGIDNEIVKKETITWNDGKQHPKRYWLRTKLYGTTAYESTSTEEDDKLQWYYINEFGCLYRDQLDTPRSFGITPMFCI